MTDAALANLQLLKNAIAACVLPPGPLLALALAGAWVAGRRRALGVAMTAVACVMLWASTCDVTADWLEQALLPEPGALSQADRARLAQSAGGAEPAAIVILGGGLDDAQTEYGRPTPVPEALERVRYGVWLSRTTGLPLAIAGGTGWASPQALPDGQRPMSEADVMGDIAVREFGCPVRWRESGSRDTRENARNAVALLASQGIRTIVLVTSRWHMPRALREFRAAAEAPSTSAATSTSSESATIAPGTPGSAAGTFASGRGALSPLRIVAAPMGFGRTAAAPALAWLPSNEGGTRVRQVLRERIGLLLAP